MPWIIKSYFWVRTFILRYIKWPRLDRLVAWSAAVFMGILAVKSCNEASSVKEQLHMDTLLLKNDSDLVRQDSDLLKLNKKTDTTIGQLATLNGNAVDQISRLIAAVQQLQSIHMIAQNEFKAQDTILHIIERQEIVSDEVDSNYLQTLLSTLQARMNEMGSPLRNLWRDSTVDIRKGNTILREFLIEIQGSISVIKLNKHLYKLPYTAANILALEDFVGAVRNDLIADESTGHRAFDVVQNRFHIWSFENDSSITTRHIAGLKAAQGEIWH